MANYNRDWDNLGRNIQEVVDRAVNSKDFQRLDRTIRQVVEQMVDVGSEAVRKAADHGSAQAAYQQPRKLYCSAAGKSAVGVLKLIAGIPLFFFGALATLGFLIESNHPITYYIGSLVVTLPLAAAGIWLSWTGGQTLGLAKRFRLYRSVLGEKTYCSLKPLARSIYKSEDYVRRDLRKMIAAGFFREGHLDKEEANLITSHETYRYYEQSRVKMEQQHQNAAVQQQAPNTQDPQLQEILRQGNTFIAKIRKCNDDIPGEEISAKIDRMELIVRRIFERAQAHPEIIPDLKKMMDYYLPMTVKLLEAYADMDAQPVQGETIRASKREIDSTLDTLNLAFEKLLDSIYEDTALDVSSDISVLNTLLAQEGLTEDGFTKNNIERNG